MIDQPCPCGVGESYAACCRPRHDGSRPAGTAAELMRSRFSAFAVGDADYLRATWHRTTRPARLVLDGAVRWTRLEIVDTVDGGPADETGVVEFRAHYRAGSLPGSLHERSTFARVDGRWLYVTGAVR